MASATISEIKSYFMGNVGTSSKNQEVSGSQSFSQVFDKTQGSGSDEDTMNTSVKAKKPQDENSIQNHANIQKKNAPDQLKDTTGENEITEEQMVEEAVEEAAEAMVNKIAETFEVSEEDVENILETLGLTPLDLLNCENLVKVVAAFNPGADALTIMTNEQLFADLKSLMNTAQDLLGQMQQQFQMSEEDMTALLASMKEMPQAETEVAEQPVIGMEAGFKEVADTQPQTVTVTMETEVDETAEDNNDKKLNVQDETAKTTKTTEKTAEQPVENTAEKQNSHTETRDDSQAGARQSFAQNLVNQLAEAVDQVNTTQTTYGVSGQEIISQITEYIKVHVNLETTEMELQLQPASLGNIKVQIASTEGMLTATFTTENEAVKSVLEAQLIQLKESFEQQGLKVNSVEVNVAAQSFERSLDQQERDQESFQKQRQKGQRRIRLTGLEEMEEDLPEGMLQEDQIVADMMIRNGNTVDYTV